MRREFPPGANPRALTDIRRAPTACESGVTPGALEGDSQAGTAERLVWKPKVGLQASRCLLSPTRHSTLSRATGRVFKTP